jgi:peptide/nickel transport system permease protein
MSAPFDTTKDAELLDQQVHAGSLVAASQWALIWHKFSRHRLAMVALVVVVLIYLVAAFAEFLAPYDPGKFDPRYTFAPPQQIHLFLTDEDGTRFAPHVLGYKSQVDPKSFRRLFQPDPDKIIPIGFFVEGQPYKFWGIWEANRHFLGPIDKADPFFLIGGDRLGRDLLSRTIHGTRISMSIGLVGVTFSLIIGLILGGISGYRGGLVDRVIQRVIEFIRSVPTIPLWLGLAAAMPKDWPPLQVYFAILIILSLIGWTEIARVVRGRFLSLRRAARRGQRIPPHHAPHDAFALFAHHRCHYARHSQHDPGRDGAELSGARSAAADRELGRAAPGRAKPARHHAGAMAVRARGLRGRGGAGPQFPRRWRPRRCRPLCQVSRSCQTEPF